jgi:hypothetical protein
VSACYLNLEVSKTLQIQHAPNLNSLFIFKVFFSRAPYVTEWHFYTVGQATDLRVTPSAAVLILQFSSASLLQAQSHLFSLEVSPDLAMSLKLTSICQVNLGYASEKQYQSPPQISFFPCSPTFLIVQASSIHSHTHAPPVGSCHSPCTVLMRLTHPSLVSPGFLCDSVLASVLFSASHILTHLSTQPLIFMALEYLPLSSCSGCVFLTPSGLFYVICTRLG